MSVERVAHEVRSLSSSGRHELLHITEAALRTASRRQSCERVLGAKLLVALLPESLPAVIRILNKTDDRWWYELHFSLFCFFDFAQSIPGVCDSVYQAVVEYLRTTRVKTAMAAWMAGDLLGDHWKSRKVVGDLARLALTAEHVAGREGALNGIKQALRHVNEADKAKLLHILEHVAVADRSLKLRRNVRWIVTPTDALAELTAAASPEKCDVRGRRKVSSKRKAGERK